MIDKEQIISIAERHIEGSDLFIVGCKISPANEIELRIDADSKVDIDQCITLSRAIEAELDRDAEDFELTVMSAGIGEPLVDMRQYRKLIGHSVEVILKNGVKVLAKLDEVTDESLTLSYEEKQTVEGKKRKQLVTVTRSYPFEEIKQTVEYLDFK
ncbi:MAG: ribosome assembly cofactor RimP [Alistipes sp.]|nr:ribosome assembly cofactor RimP [Alistipes sp.]